HFASAGYHTGYIGKWHLADRDPVPVSQRGGYASWLAANTLEFTSDAYRTIVYTDEGEPVLLPGYRSDACFDAAIRFVATNHDRPFYLFLSLLEPHHQNEVDAYPAPDGYEQRYQGRWLPGDLAALSAGGGTAHRHLGGYLGQIARVDEGLGRLSDSLRSLGLADDTIVAYTSDHGCHFKTRNTEYKRSAHDASVRVPLAVSGPGFRGGTSIDRPVSTLDLPPTLLDAAGIVVPEAMQGTSFLPLVRDPGAEFPDEAFIQVSESQCGRAIRTARWLYVVADPVANAWDTPESDRYIETELYDLDHDPHQLNNLAGYPSHRGIAEELRRRLLARMARAGEPPAVIVEAPEPAGAPVRHVDPIAHSLPAKPIRFD
ncbi:MAG: sulfatase-like hydrolase/transferase, partial [Stackebrandtia sp.]